MAKKTLTTSKGGSRARQQTSTNNKVDLTRQSALYGGILGESWRSTRNRNRCAGTKSLTGTLMGFTAGIMLGALAGLLVGPLSARQRGRTEAQASAHTPGWVPVQFSASRPA